MKGSQGKKKWSKKAHMMKVAAQKEKLRQQEEAKRLEKLERRQRERGIGLSNPPGFVSSSLLLYSFVVKQVKN